MLVGSQLMMSSGVKEFGDVRDQENHTPSLFAMGEADNNDNWDEQEATFRLQTLFRIMFYCARYGRRVREQVLAFGIYP